MSVEQELYLEKQILRILKSGVAVGIVVNASMYETIKEYYKNLVMTNGFNKTSDGLNKLMGIVNASSIKPILINMIGNASVFKVNDEPKQIKKI